MGTKSTQGWNSGEKRQGLYWTLQALPLYIKSNRYTRRPNRDPQVRLMGLAHQMDHGTTPHNPFARWLQYDLKEPLPEMGT